MTDPVLDFWFDFASTYSYLAAARIRPLAAAANVRVRFRPFLLGPIFKAQGWDTSPFNLYEAKGRYMWRDMERLAAGLNLPFRRPDPFPQNSVLPARVALVGLAQGWGEDFSVAVYTAQFVEDGRIDEPHTLAEILSFMNVDAPGRARSGAIGRHQASPAVRGRGGAAARRFRCAELHHRGRRVVLGQRPAGAGARLGEARRVGPYGSSRIGRPACAMCALAWRTVYSPKWKIEAASTAVA